MYDTSTTTPEPVWRCTNILHGQTGMVLCGAAQGPPAVLCCSPDARMAVVGGAGKVLASIETNGLKNHGAAMSGDGRFVAAATFTADVKVSSLLTSLLLSLSLSLSLSLLLISLLVILTCYHHPSSLLLSSIMVYFQCNACAWCWGGCWCVLIHNISCT